MKIIGLDIGNRRVGIAFGDSDLRLATPVAVIERTTLDDDARVIAHYLREYDAARWIVGLPRNMDDSAGFQAQAVVAYAEKIAAIIARAPVFWDERLSTVEATRRMQDAAPRGKKSRQPLDAIAAAVILQDYLDSLNQDSNDSSL